MNHITSPFHQEEDGLLKETLRPRTLKEFVGQEKIKDNLKVFAEAAKKRKESLDHLLLSGPPGLGKTTIAYCLSNEMETEIIATSGPILERPIDLAGILTNLAPYNILFIDEIHRIPKNVEEYLYSAIENFEIDILIDKGPGARTVKLKLPPFTLIGATTRPGLLSSPLRSRFGIDMRIDYYPPFEIKDIIKRSAGILQIPITEESAEEIAKRSRGTPRIANRLLKRVRDFAEIKGNGTIDIEISIYSLEKLQVDEFGLNEMDKKIIDTIYYKFKNGPVGLKTLSSSVGEDEGTIEEVYEPFLLREGLLNKTPRGRTLTEKAIKYIIKEKSFLF